MAPTQRVKLEEGSLFSQDVPTQATYRKVGLLNGLLIGLALAIGLWGRDIFIVADLPVPLRYPSLIFSSLFLILLTGFAGWLSARMQRMVLTVLIWLAAAVFASLIVGQQPYLGRTWTVWLADRRFWGLPVYPLVVDSDFVTLGMVLAGFLIILLLVILALLQDYRLESVLRELGENGRLTTQAWVALLLPLPLAIGAGLATGSFVGGTTWRDIQLVHRAIETAQGYEGDLFQLGLEHGVNYNALQGVREQINANYSLLIGEIDPNTVTTFVVAHFANGAWVVCRVVNEQLSFCYDASPPYTQGFASLITGQELPEDCRGCLLFVSGEWESWLEARRDRLADDLEIYHVAQWGSYVLMRAESTANDYTVECRFQGINRVTLESCREVGRAS